MKRLLFFTALMIASMQMFSANVDLATAKATAQQYAASKMAKGKLMAPSAIDMKLVKQEMNSDKPGTAVYYIFNTADLARCLQAGTGVSAGPSRDCRRSDAQCRRHQGCQRGAVAHSPVGSAGALLQPLPSV